MKEHIVRLTEDVRAALESLVRSGACPSYVVRRAQVLLSSDAGLTDKQVAAVSGCSKRTVAYIRKRFTQGGWERSVFDAPRSGRPSKFSVLKRQQVVALASNDPPEGCTRWTLGLLIEKAAEQELVEAVSKSELSLWLREHGRERSSQERADVIPHIHA